ncbi:hypothetical protein GM418_00170 [Maribellus comscasis]|uniref:Uncharacterized protein n=1 Tax=Maribellus comscasis TaxID=2681766 RepID=A0A6I6JQ33_9BACT|nr:hypothetical protein [Maribellus comscasis]QGY42123.1 hypothetical protein GM418_00170 [Maribellus comscasis]
MNRYKTHSVMLIQRFSENIYFLRTGLAIRNGVVTQSNHKKVNESFGLHTRWVA